MVVTVSFRCRVQLLSEVALCLTLMMVMSMVCSTSEFTVKVMLEVVGRAVSMVFSSVMLAYSAKQKH